MMSRKKAGFYLKKGAAVAAAAALTVTAVCVSGPETVLAEKETQAADTDLQTENQEITQAAGQKNSKEESVYVLADAQGTARKIIVSDWLKNPEGKDRLEDCSGLENIENIKGDETFSRDGDSLVWEAGGKDIYYQGTSEETLPVAVKIGYELDGKKIAPEDLAGRSGHVKMTFSYDNQAVRRVKTEEGEKEVKVPFAVISGAVLPTEHFQNVTVENGKCLSEGSNQIAVGFAVPGLKESLGLEEGSMPELPESVTVEADVEDFELEMTVTLVTNQILSELWEEGAGDLSGLKDVSGELTDASAQLKEGSSALLEGLETLDQKAADFETGAGTLLEGISAYTDGISALDEGAGLLKTGADSASQGAAGLQDGAKEASAGAESLESGAMAAAQGAGQLDTGIQSLAEGAGRLKEGAAQADAGAQALSTGAAGVAQGAAQVNSGIQKLSGMLSELGDEMENQAASYGEQQKMLEQQESQLETGLAQTAGQLEQTDAALGQIQEMIKDAEQKGTSMTAEEQEAYIGLLRQQSSLQEQKSEILQAQTGLLQQQSEVRSALGQISGALSAIDSAAGQIKDPETAGELQELLTGSSALSAGSSSLAEGAANLAAGMPGLTEGASELYDGAAALKKGSSSLAEGTGSLLSGTQSLRTGLQALAGGSAELNGGLSELAVGIRNLKDGSGRLNASGPALKDGAVQLRDGTVQLKDGTGQLKDGAEQLRDGIYRFDEEGIRKIAELLDGSLGGASESLEALTEADRLYQTYTELPEGMEGTVKFIIRTDAILRK